VHDIPGRISPVQKDQIVWHQLEQVLCSKFTFSGVFRKDDGIDGDFIENIEELRYPGHSRRQPLPPMPHTEMFGDRFDLWQTRHGTVNGQQSKAVPGKRIEIFFVVPHRSGEEL